VFVVTARLVVGLLVGAEEAVLVAIDDTLFCKRGTKVHAASWFHDGHSIVKAWIGQGNSCVILVTVAPLGFLDWSVALAVGSELACNNSDGLSRLALAVGP